MIELRAATCDDLAALWELRTRAIAHACAAHYSDAILAIWLASPVPDSLRQLVASGDGTVAVEDDCMLGYAVLNAVSGEVEGLFVEPAQQGRGIGALLMRAVEAMARTTGPQRLFLSASLNAVPFYQRVGFLIVREEMYPHRSGVGIPSVYMEKQLDVDSRVT